MIAIDTKQALIDIALKAFIERGYDSVPLKEIADATGIKQASIYYHFKDKNALLDACAQTFFGKWEQWMRESLPLDADLELMIRAIVGSLGMDSLLVLRLYDADTESGQYRFLLDILTYCPQNMAYMHAFNQSFETMLAQKMEDAKQAGVIPRGVSPRGVYVLLSALMEGSNILCFTDPQIDFQKETDQLFQMIWEGICNAR